MKHTSIAGIALMAAIASFGAPLPSRAVKPAVAPGSILAAYSDMGVAAKNPDYRSYLAETKKLMPKLGLPQGVLNAIEKGRFLDIDAFGDGWVLVSVGSVKAPTGSEPMEMPDVALVAYASKGGFSNTIEAIGDIFNELIPPEARATVSERVQIIDRTIAGAKAKAVKFAEDPSEGALKNFVPCWTLLNDRVMIFALSEKALEKQIVFQRGGGVSSKDFDSVFRLSGSEICRVAVPKVGRLVGTFGIDQELEDLGTLPDETTSISSVVKGLGDIILSMGYANGNEDIALSVEFGSPEHAQTINGLLMGALMPMKQMVAQATANGAEDAETLLAKTVIESIKPKVVGSVLRVSISVPWKQALAMTFSDIDEDDED